MKLQKNLTSFVTIATLSLMMGATTTNVHAATNNEDAITAPLAGGGEESPDNSVEDTNVEYPKLAPAQDAPTEESNVTSTQTQTNSISNSNKNVTTSNVEKVSAVKATEPTTTNQNSTSSQAASVKAPAVHEQKVNNHSSKKEVKTPVKKHVAKKAAVKKSSKKATTFLKSTAFGSLALVLASVVTYFFKKRA